VKLERDDAATINKFLATYYASRAK